MRRVAINGFGRIGRLTFRSLWNREDIEVVAINDLTKNNILAHLLKYDSAHGIFKHQIDYSDDYIIIDGKKIESFSEKNPANLPWGELEVDIVLECTGVFRKKATASLHLDAGAKKVLLSAPSKDKNFETIVIGINDDHISTEKQLYSNASCTTNCLAPVMKVLHENFGFIEGTMSTIHAYTSNQKLQDAPHKDLRRARAAAYNIIPTSTGAAKAVELVYPAIKGRLFATAIRVPVITGSLIDLTCILEKKPTNEEINLAFKLASENELQGILQYLEDPLVSSDIVGNTHSCIFDSLLTNVSNNLVKITAWYDNEAGYASRLADLVGKI